MTLELVKPTVELLQQRILSTESEFVVKFDCEMCSDGGFTFLEKMIEDRSYSYAVPCVCRLEKARVKKLAKIPPQFDGVTLETLAARNDLHPKQAEFIELLKSDPSGNFFLSGTFGTGKTYFSWALYHHAVMSDKRVYYCTLTGLLNEYKAFIQNSAAGNPASYPFLTADRLQTGDKFSIFIDDIDKARPTEYAAEQFFEIVNSIYEFQHQIVVTTNLTLADLVKHFERADERFGGAIVRRLVEKAHLIEMF